MQRFGQLAPELLAGPSRTQRVPYAARHLLVRPLYTSGPLRSGHNRWSKIRHRKGAADAQKSALYSRLTADVHSALRPPASPDPISNTRLAVALAKAREGGVPKDVVEKCFIKARAAADGSGQSVIYEAVGPSGREAMIIECITENPARTVQRLKETLHKRDCRIAPVSYLFDKKGVIVVTSTAEGSFDELFELAVEGGAEDVREVEDEEGAIFEIITPPTEMSNLTSALSDPAHSSKYPIRSSDLTFVPTAPLAVHPEGEGGGEGISEEKAEALEKIVGLLELEGDVVKVWTNLE